MIYQALEHIFLYTPRELGRYYVSPADCVTLSALIETKKNVWFQINEERCLKKVMLLYYYNITILSIIILYYHIKLFKKSYSINLHNEKSAIAIHISMW